MDGRHALLDCSCYLESIMQSIINASGAGIGAWCSTTSDQSIHSPPCCFLSQWVILAGNQADYHL
jgi:uncharacterized UBP type Zn finger protein